MARRSGDRFDRGTAFDRVDRPLRTSSASRSTRGRETGGTVYPTTLEAYNRDSDFKRWRSGLELWQGSGSTWADLKRTYLVRSFRDWGVLPGPQANELTLFPGRSSPDGSWSAVNRRRGAIILPQPLLRGDISFQTSAPRLDAHRLVLDVSGFLNSDQLEQWRSFIGDQFEDSAAPPRCRPQCLPETTEAVAYTLAEVDAAAGRLLFDLSRPFLRLRASPSSLRMVWVRGRYRPDAPARWRDDGSRMLCSSHRFFCSCPDFSGTRTANLIGGASGQELFPRPSAGRELSGRWEAENVGYRTRWRDLPPRADQRRECKHIHALRWSLGCPFREPSDYPIGDDDRQFLGGRGGLSGAEVERYQALRELTLDQAIVPLANSAAVTIDTQNIVPVDEEAPTSADRRPVLWTASQEPPAGRARVDDWWLLRGTETLRIFDPALERFVEAVPALGVRRPFVEPWPEGALVPLEAPCP